MNTIDLSKYIVEYYNESNIHINPLELQRILFFIHSNSNIIPNVDSLKMPYFSDVYKHYCCCGIFPILDVETDYHVPNNLKPEINNFLDVYSKNNFKKDNSKLYMDNSVVSELNCAKATAQIKIGSLAISIYDKTFTESQINNMREYFGWEVRNL